MSCSSWIPKNGLYGHCKDGFPQITGICGSDNSKGIPVCLSENMCERLYPETGTPDNWMLDITKQTQTGGQE